MQIHNIMEDVVIETVNDMFDMKKEALPVANCYQCRLDVACYVLNRMSPEYIISGRGLVHMQSNYNKRLQKSADLVALVKEGMEKVLQNQRPYYHTPQTDNKDIRPPLFNFPAIVGRILHGTTFEPIANIAVTLYMEGKKAPMIDSTWSNPYYVVESIQGGFTFLPRPVKADQLGQKKEFAFEVRVDEADYEPINHFFTLEAESSDTLLDTFCMDRTYKTQDLYLFKPGESDECEG